jgi:hypothetical protein
MSDTSLPGGPSGPSAPSPAPSSSGAPSSAPSAPAPSAAPPPGAPTPSSTPTPPAPKPTSIREHLDKAFVETKLGEQEGFVRDANGRFAPKDPAAPVAPVAPTLDPNAPAPQLGADPDAAPERFSPEGKAAWATASPALKAEIKRGFANLENGLKSYQQAFEPLKPYFALAKQHGTTPHEAMERYVSFERALVSQNPAQKMAALQEVFQISGVPVDQFAAAILGQEAPPRDQQIDALQQKIAWLEEQVGGVTQTFEQQQYQQQLAANERSLDNFATTHPRIDEPVVANYMVYLMQTSMPGDIARAYEEATKFLRA